VKAELEANYRVSLGHAPVYHERHFLLALLTKSDLDEPRCKISPPTGNSLLRDVVDG
jgi:hypothetical protein